MICDNHQIPLDPNDDRHCQHYQQPDAVQDPGFCNLGNNFLCVEGLITNGPFLRHSAVNDWLKCRYYYWLRWVKGIVLKSEYLATPLKLGILLDNFINRQYDLQFPKLNIDQFQLDGEIFAKLIAVTRAIRDLSIKFDTGTPQKMFTHNIGKQLTGLDEDSLWVTGTYDVWHENYFEEYKFSSRPDNYNDKFTLTSQLATYFLADPNLLKCVMRVIRVPGQKMKDGDTDGTYQDRIYKDIIKRPAFYFRGWNVLKRTFGKTFYRNEFPLDRIRDRYRMIQREISDAVSHRAIYQQDSWRCADFGSPCSYQMICKTGGVNWERFRRMTQDEMKGR